MSLRTKVRMIGNNAISISSTDTEYSEIMDLSNSVAGSFQLIWTGATPVMTESVWASNSELAVKGTDVQWIDVSATFTIVDVTGNSGSGFVTIAAADHAYQKYKLKFVNISGDAVILIHGVGIVQTN